jgi:hypothetical protein
MRVLDIAPFANLIWPKNTMMVDQRDGQGQRTLPNHGPSPSLGGIANATHYHTLDIINKLANWISYRVTRHQCSRHSRLRERDFRNGSRRDYQHGHPESPHLRALLTKPGRKRKSARKRPLLGELARLSAVSQKPTFQPSFAA